MEFVSKKKMFDAVHMIENGRKGARQFKMKQIFKALGIDADDMPLTTPPHCQTFHDEISETCSSSSATPLLSFSAPINDTSSGTPVPPLSATPLLAESKHERESSQDELVKASEELFAPVPQNSASDLSVTEPVVSVPQVTQASKTPDDVATDQPSS